MLLINNQWSFAGWSDQSVNQMLRSQRLKALPNSGKTKNFTM